MKHFRAEMPPTLPPKNGDVDYDFDFDDDEDEFDFEDLDDEEDDGLVALRKTNDVIHFIDRSHGNDVLQLRIWSLDD